MRSNNNLSLVEREEKRLVFNRRGFLVSAAAAVGSFWIRPLHVEAKDNFFTKMVDFFKAFAQGILFNFLGQMISPVLGQSPLLNGMKFIDDGAGSFTLDQILPPNPSSTGKFLQRILSMVGTGKLSSFFAYGKKILDVLKKPTNLPIPPIVYANSPAMMTLGQDAKTYVDMFPAPAEPLKDNRPGLLLPVLQGKLIDKNVSGDLLVGKPPDFGTNKFSQIYEDDKGSITVILYESQDVKRDKNNIVERGQGKTNMYIIASPLSDNKVHREKYAHIKRFINMNTSNNSFWTNEDKQKEFVGLLASNSALKPNEFKYEFENDR